jgi:hypothetical protein
MNWKPIISDSIDSQFNISFDDFNTIAELTEQGYSLEEIQQIMRDKRTIN